MEFFAAFCLISMLLADTINTAVQRESRSDFSITVPPECVGKELCLTRPIDYPAEEIDQLARHMARRRRRQTISVQEPVYKTDNDNCVENRKNIQPFLIFHNSTQHLVIQSQFLTQVIPAVTCRTELSPCFQSLDLSSTHYCHTKHSSWSLAVYNFKQKKVENYETRIPVDCVCRVD